MATGWSLPILGPLEHVILQQVDQDTGDDKDHPTYHTWGHTDQQQLHLGGGKEVCDVKHVATTTTDVEHLCRSKVMLGVMARIGTQPALRHPTYTH